MVQLMHGLASLSSSLSDGSYIGLIRYPGDHLVTAIAIGLSLLCPTIGIIALGGQSGDPAVWLGLFVFALPVVALFDAKRAGEAGRHAGAEIPMPPVTPGPVAEAARDYADFQPDILDHIAPFRGTVRRVDDGVVGPVSGEIGVVSRCDVRAGQHASVLAREIQHSQEFVVESRDGSAWLVIGPVSVDGSAYSVCRDAGQVTLRVAGTDLLPAEFSEGGWACELLVRDGDTVDVHGEPTGETRPHPLGAAYRSTGAIELVRGAPGHPIRVSVRGSGRDVDE